MELRPRPPGREFRGHTRVSVRRWIKDPAERLIVPDHILNMSERSYMVAVRASERHRADIKDNPQRPPQLDSGFFEPEIFTFRRSTNQKKYLVRHPDMMEPTSAAKPIKRSSSKSSNLSADSKVVKLEE